MVSKRFDELYPPAWSVPFYYYSEANTIIHGGHWDFQVATADEALAAFYHQFNEVRPGYVESRLEVGTPSRNFNIEDLINYIELLERELAEK